MTPESPLKECEDQESLMLLLRHNTSIHQKAGLWVLQVICPAMLLRYSKVSRDYGILLAS